MKKKDKIYDSPEYKQIREHLPEILKEISNTDHRIQVYTQTNQGQSTARNFGISHARVYVGERLELTSVAQADDIGKTTENGFEEGKYQYAVNGNAEENEDGLIIDGSDETTFEESNLKTLYEKLKVETKAPMIWLTEIADDSKVTYATYNKRYRAISYRVLEDDTYIYVSQKKQIEETSDGVVNKTEFIQEVEVSDLNMKTNIYESTQDNSLYCNLSYDNNTISIVSNMNLESYIQLIEGLEYH